MKEEVCEKLADLARKVETLLILIQEDEEGEEGEEGEGNDLMTKNNWLEQDFQSTSIKSNNLPIERQIVWYFKVNM